MRLAAVIVNWNQPDLTRRCVASLAAGTRVPDWIIVVDNGSRVDPTESVHGAWHDVDVVRNAENLGFAGGANAGIERAFALGAEAALLINNDAVAERGCVGALEHALERDGTLAAVGGKTLTDEEPPRIHHAYGVLTFHGDLVQRRGWLEADVGAFGVQRDVDYISGCVMLVRRQAIERVGLFDPNFFAYHEDLDWCTRAWRRGYRVSYVPAALVRHRMHASTGGGGYLSPITYLSQRNSVLFVRKHATLAQKLKYAVYLTGNLLKEARFRSGRGEMAGFRLRLRGLRDGILGRAVPLRELGLTDGQS